VLNLHNLNLKCFEPKMCDINITLILKVIYYFDTSSTFTIIYTKIVLL